MFSFLLYDRRLVGLNTLPFIAGVYRLRWYWWGRDGPARRRRRTRARTDCLTRPCTCPSWSRASPTPASCPPHRWAVAAATPGSHKPPDSSPTMKMTSGQRRHQPNQPKSTVNWVYNFTVQCMENSMRSLTNWTVYYHIYINKPVKW